MQSEATQDQTAQAITLLVEIVITRWSPGRCKVLVSWAAMNRSHSLTVCLDDLLDVLHGEV